MRAPEVITITAKVSGLDYELIAAAAEAEGVGVSDWAATALPLMAANCLREFLPGYIDELSERGLV